MQSCGLRFQYGERLKAVVPVEQKGGKKAGTREPVTEKQGKTKNA